MWLHEILLDFFIWRKPPIFIDICGSGVKGWMDWPTDRPFYRNAWRHLVNLIYLLGHFFAQKCWLSLFLTKASLMDGPTDWPTDKPGYRDARTHLKSNLKKLEIGLEIKNPFKTVEQSQKQLKKGLKIVSIIWILNQSLQDHLAILNRWIWIDRSLNL